MADHYVSPSALGEFRKCRRCFFMDRNLKIKRPRGAFPTLPDGIDRALKTYFDAYRAGGNLPPEIERDVPDGTTLFKDMAQLTAMRNARKPLLTTTIGNVKLVGGLDELLVGPDGAVSPFDYKTKGAVIKDDADPFNYYRMQLNDYGLLLEAFGMTLSGKGYLGYWSPEKAESLDRSPCDCVKYPSDTSHHVLCLDRENKEQEAGLADPNRYGTMMAMFCQVFSMDLDLEAAQVEVLEAGACLDGELPDASPECETCAFIVSYVRAAEDRA